MREQNEHKEHVERKVSELLEEGKLESPQPELLARQRLAPKYEIRQTVQLDPIVEETKLYRQMAREVDNRYDLYMKRAGAAGRLSQEEEQEEEMDRNDRET